MYRSGSFSEGQYVSGCFSSYMNSLVWSWCGFWSVMGLGEERLLRLVKSKNWRVGANTSR